MADSVVVDENDTTIVVTEHDNELTIVAAGEKNVEVLEQETFIDG